MKPAKFALRWYRTQQGVDDAKPPKKGTKLAWGTAQGETEGTVEKAVTKTTKIKAHTAKATKEEKQVMVKSGKSGKTAIHKPEEIKKI